MTQTTLFRFENKAFGAPISRKRLFWFVFAANRTAEIIYMRLKLIPSACARNALVLKRFLIGVLGMDDILLAGAGWLVAGIVIVASLAH